MLLFLTEFKAPIKSITLFMEVEIVIFNDPFVPVWTISICLTCPRCLFRDGLDYPSGSGRFFDLNLIERGISR